MFRSACTGVLGGPFLASLDASLRDGFDPAS